MNSNRKKILFLITKSNWGGAQRYVFDLATSLNTKTYEVVVAFGGNGALIEKLNAVNIRTIKIKSLQRDISLYKDIKICKELHAILKREQPEIFHINSSKAGILGSLIGRMTRVPNIIFTAHGWAFNEKRPFLQKIIIKSLHWLTVLISHHTIAVSKVTKGQMNWIGTQGKMTVIYNGINPISMLEKVEARNVLVGKNFLIKPYKDSFWTGTIAELHPIKSHKMMINAIKLLTSNNPKIDIRHIIIGDGEYRDRLEKYVISQNLTDRIFFAGHIHEASKLLKAFDVFTLTSKSEALAYVIIEAGFAGLPIISTAVGGIPEIITHKKNGLLIHSGDIEKLALNIKKLISSPELRDQIGNNVFETIQHFSVEKMFTETEKLYLLK